MKIGTTEVAAIAFIASALAGYASAQAARGDSGFIDATDSQRLFYRVDGNGAERIVALHGGPGLSFTYLQPELTELAASYALIYYDQRGGGSSTITSDPALLTAGKHVEDLEAVRSHFGIERMTLLGHSWGAGLAASYAARYPQNVGRLILVGSIPPRRDPYIAQFEANLFSWMDAATLAEFERLSAAREVADSIVGCNAFWQLFIRGYVADRQQPPVFRGGPCDLPVAALHNTDVVYEATVGSLGEWDWRPQLAAIRVPTLVIHGENDPIPLESAREWASTVPNATLVVVEDSGHFPFVEQRPVFLEAVQKFLDETASR